MTYEEKKFIADAIARKTIEHTKEFVAENIGDQVDPMPDNAMETLVDIEGMVFDRLLEYYNNSGKGCF